VKRLRAAAVLSARAWLALAEVDLQLRRHGFQTTLAAATASSASVSSTSGAAGPNQRETAMARGRRYAAAIQRAARCYPGRAECLQQSIVLHRWLQHEGVPSTVQLGVLRGHDGNKAFRAHAWVELDGTVLNDRVSAVRVFARLMAPELPNYLIGASR
jgi:hypothetical protein